MVASSLGVVYACTPCLAVMQRSQWWETVLRQGLDVSPPARGHTLDQKLMLQPCLEPRCRGSVMHALRSGK